jgi:predicted transcriptional regulator
MQALVSGQKIEEDTRKDAILEVMSDKYCRAILENTMEKPKSAMEISAETKIPISTVYRRLQTLHDNKLLGISGSISDDGKKYFLYKSKVKAIAAAFNGNFVEIEIVPNR